MLALARTASFAVAAFSLSATLTLAQPPAAQPAPGPAGADSQGPPIHRMHAMPLELGPMSHAGCGRGAEERFHGGPGGWETGGLRMGPGGMWWKNPRIAERLSLTAEQTKRMDDIVEHSRLELIDLRANLEKQQVMLGPIMDSNPVDTARASAQIDKVANSRADLEKANAKMLLSIRGVLTPEQWTKLHERPSHDPQPAAGGAPGTNATPAPGSGRWHGGRAGGPAGMENLAPPIGPQ